MQCLKVNCRSQALALDKEDKYKFTGSSKLQVTENVQWHVWIQCYISRDMGMTWVYFKCFYHVSVFSNMWNEQVFKHIERVLCSFTQLSFWEETHRNTSVEGRNYEQSYYTSSETLQALNTANKQWKPQKHMKQPTEELLILSSPWNAENGEILLALLKDE